MERVEQPAGTRSSCIGQSGADGSPIGKHMQDESKPWHPRSGLGSFGTQDGVPLAAAIDA
jgi:hypothetical protein